MSSRIIEEIKNSIKYAAKSEYLLAWEACNYAIEASNTTRSREAAKGVAALVKDGNFGLAGDLEQAVILLAIARTQLNNVINTPAELFQYPAIIALLVMALQKAEKSYFGGLCSYKKGWH